jgi:hypothetical protein
MVRIVMLSVIMLIVILLSIDMLSVVMPSTKMLIVINFLKFARAGVQTRDLKVPLNTFSVTLPLS